ncbi:MAG: hypothetical protein JHC38_04005 [Thiotrichales bacterium]|jgi:hypothetical protein|nr:hypothetical protein [Thiotrichales bacterium]
MNSLSNESYCRHQVTEVQQLALSQLNDVLNFHEPMISHRIWRDMESLQARANSHDWINDTEYDVCLVFTWRDDAPEYQANGSCIATCLYDYYRTDASRTEWQSNQNWHNDACGDHVYPVSGKHNIWFHGLYDHCYDDGKLSWEQMSRLGGCYLDIQKTYQCLVSFSASVPDAEWGDDDIGSKRTFLKKLNEVLYHYEMYCRQELITQDLLCSAELQDAVHPLFDYDITLSVLFHVTEKSRYYTEENGGEVALIYVPCKGISQQPSEDMQSIGDGKNHNRQRSQRDLHSVHCFLFQALLERTLVADDAMVDIDDIYFNVNVYRKEWAIKDFRKVLPRSARQ